MWCHFSVEGSTRFYAAQNSHWHFGPGLFWFIPTLDLNYISKLLTSAAEMTLSDWTPAISRAMSLKKIGLKILLRATVDLEASQRARSPSPSGTRHVVLPSPDREGREALVYPSPRESLVSLSLVFGKKQLLFHRFYDASPECPRGKIKQRLLGPWRESRLGFYFCDYSH